MARLRAHNLAVSLDGDLAGPDQSMDEPLGAGGPRLHRWVSETRTFRSEPGLEGGADGVDDGFLARGTARGQAN